MADTIKLNEIIKELEFESHDDEGFLGNTKQSAIIFHVRNAFATLLQDGKMSGFVTSLEMPINNGWRAELPEDYLRYVRISGVDDDGKLHKLFIDGRINSSGGYLLDEKGVYLLDEMGVPLKGTSHDINKGNKSYNATNTTLYHGDYIPVGFGRQYNLTSGIETEYGQYKLSREDGIIRISDSPFKSLVLDYIADPAHFIEGGISSLYAPKLYKEAIKALAYFNIIKRRRSNRVPENEKVRAERDHEKLTKNAQLKSMPSIQEMRQILKRSNGLFH